MCVQHKAGFDLLTSYMVWLLLIGVCFQNNSLGLIGPNVFFLSMHFAVNHWLRRSILYRTLHTDFHRISPGCLQVQCLSFIIAHFYVFWAFWQNGHYVSLNPGSNRLNNIHTCSTSLRWLSDNPPSSIILFTAPSPDNAPNPNEQIFSCLPLHTWLVPGGWVHGAH